MDTFENKVLSPGKERGGSKKSGGSPPRRDIKKAAASANEDKWKKKSDGWKAKIARDYSKFDAPAPAIQALAGSATNGASSYYGIIDAENSDTFEDEERAMDFGGRYDKMLKGMAWINEMRAKEGAIKSRLGPWGFKLTKAVSPFTSSNNDLISTIASSATASNIIGTASDIIAPMKGRVVTIESDDEPDNGDKQSNMGDGASVFSAVRVDANVTKLWDPARCPPGENLNNLTSSDKRFIGVLDFDIAHSDPWDLDIDAMDMDSGFHGYPCALSFRNMAKFSIVSSNDCLCFGGALPAGFWASPWNKMGSGRKVGEDMDFKAFDVNITLSSGSWLSLWNTPEHKLVDNEYVDEAMNFRDGLSYRFLPSRIDKVVAIESDDEAMYVDTGLSSLSLASSPAQRALVSGLPSAILANRAKRPHLPGVGVPLFERPRDRKKLIKLLTVPRNKGFLDAFEKRHLEPFLKKPIAERIPDELKLQIFADAAGQWLDEGKCFHVIANTNGFELSLWQGCRHYGCKLPVGLQLNKLSRDVTLKIMFMRALKSDGLTHHVPNVGPFMYQGLSILDLNKKEMVRLESEKELSEGYRRYVAVQRLKALNLLADRNLISGEN